MGDGHAVIYLQSSRAGKLEGCEGMKLEIRLKGQSKKARKQTGTRKGAKRKDRGLRSEKDKDPESCFETG
jgi:hypothetical protein